MSGPSISGGEDPHVSGLPPPVETESGGETTPSSTSVSPTTVSSIGQSKETEDLTIYQADTIFLPLPGEEGTIETLMTISESGDHDLKMSILDGWLKSIEEDSQRMRERINSPEYQQMLERVSPQAIAEIQQNSPAHINLAVMAAGVQNLPYDQQNKLMTVSRENNLKVGISESLNGYLQNVSQGNTEAVTALPLLAGSIVIGLPAVAELGQIAQTNGIPNMTIPAVDNVLNNFVPIAHASNAAMLGLLGGMFMQGAFYQAGATTIKEGQENGKMPITADIAKNYAENVKNLIKSNTFNAFVSRMFPGKGQAAEYQQFSAMLKLTLLSSALAMTYIAEAGWITSQELGAMISGKIEIEAKDPKAELVALMRQQLGDIQDPKEREKILNAIFDYIDSRPSGKDLEDFNNVINSVFSKYSGNSDDFPA